MIKKVVLIGCGQLGSRHLQAMASLVEIGQIHVIDSNPDSLMLGQQRIREIKDINPAIKFYWHTAFDPMASDGDLCVIATQAKGRLELIKTIVEKLNYRNFLIEKVVAQSMQEYDLLLDLSLSAGLSIKVHCQTRGFDVHQYIKAKLDSQSPLVFTEIGGNLGLACNGIHYADLFAFYTSTTKIVPQGSHIDAVLHPSKRGKDIFDLSGTLRARSDNGSEFFMSYASNHASADVVTITSSKGRFVVDCIHQNAFESIDGASWRPIPIKESYMVSQTTKQHVRDLLMQSSSYLPSLQECRVAHEYILNELNPFFNKLLNVQQDFCPVT